LKHLPFEGPTAAGLVLGGHLPGTGLAHRRQKKSLGLEWPSPRPATRAGRCPTRVIYPTGGGTGVLLHRPSRFYRKSLPVDSVFD
jgi:hypothetical protein